MSNPIDAEDGRSSEFVTVKGTQALDQSVRSLNIATRVGHVHVVRSQGAEMAVEAEVRVDRKRVDVTQAGKNFEDHVQIKREGDTITIGDAHEKAEDRNAWSVSLKVSLPRALPISAHTGVGNIRLSVAAGKTTMATGVGTITLESVVTHLTGHVNREASDRYEAGLQVFATDIEKGSPAWSP
jgi:hypothetical protein